MFFIVLFFNLLELETIIGIILFMNEFKYQLSQLLFIIFLGLAAYWAFTRLDKGISYTRDEIVQKQAETIVDVAQNTDPSFVFEKNTETPSETPSETITQTKTPVTQEKTDEVNQPLDKDGLSKKLESIVSSGVIYSSGVKNDDVKSVQEFLDLYFKDKEISADGDFGSGTKQFIIDFQRAELDGGDGRIGPNTLKKMLEVLKTL